MTYYEELGTAASADCRSRESFWGDSRVQIFRAAPGATACSIVLLLFLLAVWAPKTPVAQVRRQLPSAAPFTAAYAIDEDNGWEPLATYAYDSHLALPPLPFSGLPEPTLAANGHR
jgi:hypothetical protein